MNKEQLIQLANDTFFDNDTGEITPASHRAFIQALVEAVPDPEIASTLSPGLVKSSATPLKVAVDSNGIMSVNELVDTLNKKQGTIPNITITNFDTFNPQTATNLNVGESCFFQSEMATGRPDYYIVPFNAWCGTITRIHANAYRLLAMSAETNKPNPQLATKLYSVSGGNVTAYKWQFLTESASLGELGFAKFPSGLMLQWGYTTATQQNVWVQFSENFITLRSISTAIEGSATYDGPAAAYVYGQSLAGFNLRRRITSNGGGLKDTSSPVYWQAVGEWKQIDR